MTKIMFWQLFCCPANLAVARTSVTYSSSHRYGRNIFNELHVQAAQVDCKAQNAEAIEAEPQQAIESLDQLMASSVVRVLIDHIPDLGLDGMLRLVLKQPSDVRHHLLVLAVIIHLASFPYVVLQFVLPYLL